ncbi:hypothetical protein FIBSPDRAFT_904055 [Athelia psychrophila]|uniref:Uncharacterized protein n=1 Tax=Athelia psychrophila TaxID=1759441 RepID=A0A167V7J1_9AGAM|nr:hypothetical protein FIBSPDRAFT_904055 [Fibularhizoctonia sp. CBS 109695]
MSKWVAPTKRAAGRWEGRAWPAIQRVHAIRYGEEEYVSSDPGAGRHTMSPVALICLTLQRWPTGGQNARGEVTRAGGFGERECSGGRLKATVVAAMPAILGLGTHTTNSRRNGCAAGKSIVRVNRDACPDSGRAILRARGTVLAQCEGREDAGAGTWVCGDTLVHGEAATCPLGYRSAHRSSGAAGAVRECACSSGFDEREDRRGVDRVMAVMVALILGTFRPGRKVFEGPRGRTN